jgi:hypothetical protein
MYLNISTCTCQATQGAKNIIITLDQRTGQPPSGMQCALIPSKLAKQAIALAKQAWCPHSQTQRAPGCNKLDLRTCSHGLANAPSGVFRHPTHNWLCKKTHVRAAKRNHYITVCLCARVCLRSVGHRLAGAALRLWLLLQLLLAGPGASDCYLCEVHVLLCSWCESGAGQAPHQLEPGWLDPWHWHAACCALQISQGNTRRVYFHRRLAFLRCSHMLDAVPVCSREDCHSLWPSRRRGMPRLLVADMQRGVECCLFEKTCTFGELAAP